MIAIPDPGPLSDLLRRASERLSASLESLAGASLGPPEAGEILGDPDVLVGSLAAAAEAGPGALCFAVKVEFLELAKSRGAAAVIVTKELAAQELAAQATAGGPVLAVHREPRLLFAVILGLAGEKAIPSFGPGEPYFNDRRSCSIGEGVTFGPFST